MRLPQYSVIDEGRNGVMGEAVPVGRKARGQGKECEIFLFALLVLLSLMALDM